MHKTCLKFEDVYHTTTKHKKAGNLRIPNSQITKMLEISVKLDGNSAFSVLR